MKKQFMVTAMALMLATGAMCGMNDNEAQAASQKVAINKKNFPDKVFRELVKKNYDKNKDNKLSKKEIKKAKKFGSSSTKTMVKIKPSKYAKYEKKYVKDIKNFKGIEKLTNLRKLVANETSVKTINLKKNTKLNYLQMEDGKLTKLNLNKNTKLKYVYLNYNQLTSLKMNKCKKLLDVEIYGHMVKDLKIDRNKKTKVKGEAYYAPFEVAEVKETFTTLNDGGTIDVNGNYCVYEWANDYSACVKKTMGEGTMTSVSMAMDSATITKAKAMQNITAQWQDAQGNFYFIADKDGDMVANTVNHLYKVNAQGAIEKEIVLNDMMNIPSGYNGRYHLYYMNQNEGVVSLKMTTGGDNNGVVYFDMNTMRVTKQVECDFMPTSTEGDVVVGTSGEYFPMVVVSKIPTGKIKEFEDGSTIELCQLSSAHKMEIPLRNVYGMGYSVYVKNNYVYAISGEGFFKAKLTANKFTQLYGISKIANMQNPDMKYTMTMAGENEIYLMCSTTEENEEGEAVTTYTLQHCKATQE